MQQVNLYQDQFSEEHDFPKTEKPSKFLVIASTARSGSHMLGHALHRTGRFGFPLEYANPVNLPEWKRRLGVESTEEALDEIQKRRTSPNGVFGIKVHYEHLEQFGGFDRMVARYPDARYVLLSRENVLRQAVSLAIAEQTGVWISGQEPMSDETPRYDFEQIDRCLRETLRNNTSWRYTLAASGCNYIEMNFDEVRHDLSQSIQTIAGHLGIEIDPSEIRSEHATKKQSGDLNREWSRRFTDDFNRSSELFPRESSGPLKRLKRLAKRVLRPSS